MFPSMPKEKIVRNVFSLMSNMEKLISDIVLKMIIFDEESI